MPGSGGSSSGSRRNDFDAIYDFEIFSLQADAQTPTTFSGAAENFKGIFTDNGSSEFDFANGNGSPDIDTRNNPLTLNLQAKELKVGDPITLLSGNPALDSFNPQQTLPAPPLDRIEFTLFSNELANLGIDEFTLIIEDDDPNTPGLQAGGKDLDASLATANGFSENDAIKYIIDNSLLSLVDGIRVTGGSILQPGQIVSNQSGLLGAPTSFTPNGGRPDSPDPDPDPGTDSPIDSPTDGDDVLTGDNGDNTLNGGEGNNVLRGLEGNDVLTAGAGSDNLDGGNGNDRLSSGGGNDTLTGGAGADNIDGGEGNDTIDGGDGNDSILGGGGDDLLRGGNGDDIINGGAGLDVLVGDGGADIFAVNTLGGADVIRDFNYGQDLIGLSDGITFDQLVVTQGDGAAILSYQDQAIASISGETPGQVNASLFTTI
jgi:Ca2+-binding RTX toxin-like protein